MAASRFSQADPLSTQERTCRLARRPDDGPLYESFLEPGLGPQHANPSRCTYIAATWMSLSCLTFESLRYRRIRRAEQRRIPKEMDEVLLIPLARQITLLLLRPGRSLDATPGHRRFPARSVFRCVR